MLARKNRFHGHKSVSRVRGSRVHTPFFNVFYASNRRRDDFRMAVVVSKKTAPKAVTRNRIRRRLYEAVRTQGLLNGRAVDVVFVVTDEKLAEAPAQDIAAHVTKACQKITQQ